MNLRSAALVPAFPGGSSTEQVQSLSDRQWGRLVTLADQPKRTEIEEREALKLLFGPDAEFAESSDSGSADMLPWHNKSRRRRGS